MQSQPSVTPIGRHVSGLVRHADGLWITTYARGEIAYPTNEMIALMYDQGLVGAGWSRLGPASFPLAYVLIEPRAQRTK